MENRFEFDWQILSYCEDLNYDGWSGAADAQACALELLKARRELVALRERHDEQLSKADRFRARLAAAESIVARGVELMPLEQLSQWEGVREWQESAGEVEAVSAAKG